MVKKMIESHEFLWGFYIISLVFYFLRGLKKAISMASLTLINSPLSPPPPSSSCSGNPSWVGQFLIKQDENRQENSPPQIFPEEKTLHENDYQHLHGKVSDHDVFEDKIVQENMSSEAYQNKGLVNDHKLSETNPNLLESGGILSDSLKFTKAAGINNNNNSISKRGIKLRKRPAKLVLPEFCANLGLCEMERKFEKEEFEVEGKNFCLASKKGRREMMEDGYQVMVDILGDPKQAFFAVIDGHGGRGAADYVAENLGRNIVKEIGNVGELGQAIRSGYQVTDREFLGKGVSSGACVATVLLKDGELHAANAGDCRVVLSRNGVADSLTNDHRPSREDERLRIENAGGFVNLCNGVWRVQGSLAVSRAIGDLHLKEWIISEPEITRLPLTSDCQFLIMASDGLLDKVNEQEAVDVVSRNKNSLESCKMLIDLSSSRGNMDDVTVLVINLENFVTNNL